jgi:hypothetical protein
LVWTEEEEEEAAGIVGEGDRNETREEGGIEVN